MVEVTPKQLILDVIIYATSYAIEAELVLVKIRLFLMELPAPDRPIGVWNAVATEVRIAGFLISCRDRGGVCHEVSWDDKEATEKEISSES